MDIIVGDMYYLKPGSKSWGGTDLSQYKTVVVVGGPDDDGDVEISVADDSYPNRRGGILVNQDLLSKWPWDKFTDSPWIKTSAPKEVSDLKVGDLIDVDNCWTGTKRTVAALISAKDGREYVAYRWEDDQMSGVFVAEKDRVKKLEREILVGDQIQYKGVASGNATRTVISVTDGFDGKYLVYEASSTSGSRYVSFGKADEFVVKEPE